MGRSWVSDKQLYLFPFSTRGQYAKWPLNLAEMWRMNPKVSFIAGRLAVSVTLMARPLTDRVLHALHNLAAVNPDSAKTLPELVQVTQEPADRIRELLIGEEETGHVKSLTDEKSERRYYLTGLGILRAVSMLT
jgi:hypothetical protein